MINEVRNAVLSILNKNNYGYISPSDFNSIAANAQMEIYEEYYSSYNKVINAENARMSGIEYADIEQPIAETLETFMVTNTLTNYLNNQYYTPSLTTTGDEAYYLLKVLCYPKVLLSGIQAGGEGINQLICNTVNFNNYGIVPGDIVINTTTKLKSTVDYIFTPTQLVLTSNIFPPTAPSNDGFAIYQASSLTEADKVSLSKITMLNASNLTAPSVQYPSYTYQGNKIELYPSTIKYPGLVSSVYFRYPKTPKWTYITLTNGEPSFDQSQPDYQDFELPNEDGYKLVTKMLEYLGVEIRELEVSAFGTAQQQHEQPTFSMQQ